MKPTDHSSYFPISSLLFCTVSLTNPLKFLGSPRLNFLNTNTDEKKRAEVKTGNNFSSRNKRSQTNGNNAAGNNSNDSLLGVLSADINASNITTGNLSLYPLKRNHSFLDEASQANVSLGNNAAGNNSTDNLSEVLFAHTNASNNTTGNLSLYSLKRNHSFLDEASQANVSLGNNAAENNSTDNLPGVLFAHTNASNNTTGNTTGNWSARSLVGNNGFPAEAPQSSAAMPNNSRGLTPGSGMPPSGYSPETASAVSAALLLGVVFLNYFRSNKRPIIKTHSHQNFVR